MFPTKFFSFIVKTRAAYNIVENVMKAFHFEENNFWQYDPYHFISNMIFLVGSLPYIPHEDAGT